MKHSQDAAPDAPKGAGGVPGGSGGGGSVGVAGAAGIGGPDAGAGGSIPDGPSDLSLGTGGSADANRDVATSPGTGGAAGSGGRGGSGGAAGGVAGTGGATGAGGVTGRGGGGGASGAGGKTGTGGATGKGGSSGVDGGATEYLCAYECRADASGVTGWYSGSELICTADCLGRTARCLYVGTRSEGCYADSTSAGCDSSYNGLIAWTTCGVLPGDTGYLAWQAPGVAGTGPAVVVYGRDGAIKWWTNTAAFPPETPPYSITTPSEGLTRL
ncbi:MAG: hypothetical protein JXP73_00030, partial [Deltaproteobacteria bacterium]|nr:hypothetical protein [Deltaproteobacteria bacterium]